MAKLAGVDGRLNISIGPFCDTSNSYLSCRPNPVERLWASKPRQKIREHLPYPSDVLSQARGVEGIGTISPCIRTLDLRLASQRKFGSGATASASCLTRRIMPPSVSESLRREGCGHSGFSTRNSVGRGQKLSDFPRRPRCRLFPRRSKAVRTNVQRSG